MVWYWIILGLRKVIWFFRIPNAEQFAIVDANAKCPVCGACEGWLRCVLRAKPGAPTINPRSPLYARQMQEAVIACQHSCKTCGARWHDKPVAKNATPATVMPSPPRNDLEKAENRLAYMEETE